MKQENPAPPAFDVCPIASSVVRGTFETMLGMTLAPAPVPARPVSGEQVSGLVGFGGEGLNGALYLQFPDAFARLITAALLGMGEEEVGDAEVNDAVGELCNMIGGGIKAGLGDIGDACVLSPPAIIRGTGFRIETAPGVQSEQLHFAFGEHAFLVEIHLKLNEPPSAYAC